MSLNGVTGAGAGVAGALLRPLDAHRPRVEQEKATPAESQIQVTRQRAAGAGLLAPRQETLPLEAPAGTDPKLWEVLTAEERSFFARMNAMGPLTYGRPALSGATMASAGETPLARGGRIDVRG